MATTRQKTNTTTTIEAPEAIKRTLTDFPEWVEAIGRLADLREQRSGTLATITQLESDFQSQARTQKGWVSSKAAALVTPGAAAVADIRSVDDIKAATRTAREELAILDEAIALQERHLRDLRFTCSAEIAAGLKPEYSAIVSDLVSTARRFAEITRREQQFRYELTVEDIAFTSTIYPVNMIPAVADYFTTSSGRIASVDGGIETQMDEWLREVAEHYPEALEE